MEISGKSNRLYLDFSGSKSSLLPHMHCRLFVLYVVNHFLLFPHLINVLDFLHRDSYQGNIASKTTIAGLVGCGQACLENKSIIHFKSTKSTQISESCFNNDKILILAVPYAGCFWASQQFVQFSISLRCHDGQHRGKKFQKFPFLDDQRKFPLWSLSCTLLACHLCRLFCYQVSCFRGCLHFVQYSPCSQETGNLVSEFPGFTCF